MLYANASSPRNLRPVIVGREMLRVLHCDDDKTFRFLVRAVLDSERDIELAGEAADARACIDLAQELQPDVVLLDESMPIMSGMEAIPRIREVSPVSRIIVLSSYPADELREHALGLGAAVPVEKHGIVGMLAEAVRDAVEAVLAMARAKVGKEAPDFELPGTDGPFRLSDHRGRPRRAALLPRRQHAGVHAPVLLVSPIARRTWTTSMPSSSGSRARTSTPTSSSSWPHGLNIPLLADVDGSVAKSFGAHAPRARHPARRGDRRRGGRRAPPPRPPPRPGLPGRRRPSWRAGELLSLDL